MAATRPGEEATAAAVEAAARALGVAPDAAAHEVDAAYRRLVLLHHPDRAAGADPVALAEAGRRTAELNAARALLLARPAAAVAASPAEAPRQDRAHNPEEPYAFPLAHDTLAVDAPAEAAFEDLVAVGAGLGDVVADRSAKLIEVRALADDGPVTILLCLQGRATGLTEAFVSLTDDEGEALPWLGVVVELLASRMNEQAAAAPW